jgi:dihydroxyacetone kinase-like protein
MICLSMTDRVTRLDLSRMMAAAASQIRERHAWLSQLDCVAGDGDHGSAMLRTVDRLEKVFGSDTPADLRTIFCEAGWSVMGADGGASTSLIGTFFLGMGEATAAAVSSWDCQGLADAFRAGLAAVQAQTKAAPGDKTMMDALTPAVEALAKAASAGHDVDQAFADAALEAKAGAERTQNMIARLGRARLLGEKTRGSQDPGAASIALLFEGFYQGVKESEGDTGNA